MTVLLAALVLAAASGVPGLFLPREGRAGERIAAVLLSLASAMAIGAALGALGGFFPAELRAGWAVPGGELHVAVDGISALFLLQIFFIAPLAAVYGLEYWPSAAHPGNGRKLRLFYGLLAAALGLVVVARNAVLFLAAWEVMALSAFFTLTTEDHEPAVRDTGLLYLIATRLGTLALIAMFVLLHRETGSWEIAPAPHPPSGRPASAIFLLALFGFGLKAGVMPLHVWLPDAHATAPSHVSALMSGVLIKSGIYGLVRACTLFPAPPAWWGGLVLVLGVASGVLGVAFALAQHDLKRLLAYHSVENIGIILIGLGVSMLGVAVGRGDLAALGIAGALLHVLNHGLFKSLLFLGAGAVAHETGTRAIEELGGLSKRMPMTALAFLAGAVAICGLPPLNGFVSELLVYLGLLRAVISPGGGESGGGPSPGSGLGARWAVLAAFAAPALALVGALALACFVKVFGVVFLGTARTPKAERAADPGLAMLAPMGALVAACAVIGIAPVALAPLLDLAIASFTSAGRAAAPMSIAELAPLRAVGLAGAFTAVLTVTLAFAYRTGLRAAPIASSPTWGCGYSAPAARMQYSASSFADGLVRTFAWALRPDAHRPELRGPFPAPSRFERHVPDVVLDRALRPAFDRAAWLLTQLRWLQRGSTHAYLVYILAAILLLFVSRT